VDHGTGIVYRPARNRRPTNRCGGRTGTATSSQRRFGF
jgi:hypothetical protein